MVTSLVGYQLVLAATALERLVELALSQRNARACIARGGVEHGRGHYPAMVALHTSFLIGCAVEPLLSGRSPAPALGVPMLAAIVSAQALRWWCIATLGDRWNTRVIVTPGAPRVRRGPYRIFPHPNYVAVVVEGMALPLLGGAYLTAIVFTALNAWLLAVRIRAEDRALAEAEPA